jgi:flagellar motility protein MotE (MotC chaperone)
MLLALVKLTITGSVLWQELRADYPVAAKKPAQQEPAPTPVLAPAQAFAQEEEAADPAAQAPEAAEPAMGSKEQQAQMDELRRRELELKELESRIDQKLERLADLESKLQRMLEEADVLKDKKLRHLVDVYSNMKAKQAATVLETLDQDIAVKILAGMRGRQAGEILTNVQADKAAELSEALTKLQTPFN